MEHSAILQPVIALVLWTMIMWLWMYVTRIPAMNKAEIDTANLVGGKGADLDAILPANVQWKAHNYNHLLTEPTLFYAVALTLAMIGAGAGLNATLAWAYVGIRVLHSLVQATINRVMIRFMLFALSSVVLIWLAINAALILF
jgi:hypothetical protein